jgi:hypothetical protein
LLAGGCEVDGDVALAFGEVSVSMNELMMDAV